MVAEQHGRMIIHVDVPPETRQGFKALQFAVVEATIQMNWYALLKRMDVAYGVEENALSRAIGRAEWLARG